MFAPTFFYIYTQKVGARRKPRIYWAERVSQKTGGGVVGAYKSGGMVGASLTWIVCFTYAPVLVKALDIRVRPVSSF